MGWWDEVSYDDLSHWIPTLGRLPHDTLHDLGLLRGAVCTELREAWLGDESELRSCSLTSTGSCFLCFTPTGVVSTKASASTR